MVDETKERDSSCGQDRRFSGKLIFESLSFINCVRDIYDPRHHNK